MRVLIIGGGVIGSVYAGGLARAGHEVTLLARGKRLDDLRRAGLRLTPLGGASIVPPDVVVASTPPSGQVDLTIIALRRDQIMAAARQGAGIPGDIVMLFGNHAGMTVELAALYGPRRVIAGFPGVGGSIDGDTVRYTVITQQPTMIGAVSGGSAERLGDVAEALRSAGFPTQVERDVEGWLASHAALVVPMAAAIMACGGTASALARRRKVLRVGVGATRALYKAQRRQGRLVINANLRLLYLRLPPPVAVWYWSRALRGEFGDLAFAAHTRHAWGEMAALGAWLRTTVDHDPEAAGALDRAIDLVRGATFDAAPSLAASAK